MIEQKITQGDPRLNTEYTRPEKIADGQTGVLIRKFEVHNDPISRQWPQDIQSHTGQIQFMILEGQFECAMFISPTAETVYLETVKTGNEIFGYLHQVRKQDTDPGGSSFRSTETLDIKLI
jgi:hypothetical protein